MSGMNLQYTIVNKTLYKPKLGKIDSISNKKEDSGFLIQTKDQVDISLKLKSPGIVYTAEVRNWNTSTITFIFFKNKQKVGQYYHVFSKQTSTQLLLFEQNKDKSLVVDKIDIQLNNLHTIEQNLIGLKYLKLNGTILQSEIKKCRKLNFTQDNEQYLPVQKSSRPKVQKQFKRITKRDVKQSEQLDLYNQQMKEVLMKSLEEEKERKKLRNNKATQQKNQIIDISNQNYQQNYTKIDYYKCKDVFANVNAKWLQNQKKLEDQYRVKKNEKLSNLIKIKHLIGKKILVQANTEDKKEQLQKIASQLGAKIIKQIGEDCILVTQKKNSQKIDKAKKFKRTSIVKPQFLQDCLKFNAQLTVSQYFIKL